MKKLSATQDFLFHNMNQGHRIFNRYWKSSSLPPRERHVNRPRLGYRRDKVLSRLLNLEIQAAVQRVSSYSDEMIANVCKELGLPNPHTA